MPQMLDGLAPDKVEITSAEYYRPDGRFSPQTNSARIGLGWPGLGWAGLGWAGLAMPGTTRQGTTWVPLPPRTGVGPARSR
ncbi:hypothetical protein HOK021_35750 [Streptomyces hygroscopicus]|nr:hypothetical protein HOK021_35750 [Streptomyces hygroscopicus]